MVLFCYASFVISKKETLKMDYMQKIEELKSKIEAEELGKVEVKTVDLKQWEKIGNELAEQFEDYSTKVKRLENKKQIDDLKHEAQNRVETFNIFVAELEKQDLYTEEAKNTLYNEERKKVENDLKIIGNKQMELLNDNVDLTQASAKKAYQELKKGATTADLQPQDFNYITLILNRDNSFEVRKQLAEKYNYHFAVLDILNAGLNKISSDNGQGTFINHPLEYMQNGLSHTITGLFDVILEAGSFYNYEILKKLNNKIFNDNTERNGGLF